MILVLLLSLAGLLIWVFETMFFKYVNPVKLISIFNSNQHIRMMSRLANNTPALRKLSRGIVAAPFFSSMAGRPQFRPEDHGLDKEFRLTDFTKMKG